MIPTLIPVEVLKLIGMLAAFGAAGLCTSLLLTSRNERLAVRAGLSQAMLESPGVSDSRAAVMRKPFASRVVGPGVKNLASLVYRFGPSGLADDTRKRLVLAGLSNRLSPDTFFAISVFAPALVGALMYFYDSIGKVPPLVWVVVPASAFFPKMWLTRKVEARQQKIRLALPDTLDLLTIAVEAGLGFDAALARIVGSIRGPLSDELFRMLQELKIGISRTQAFNNLSERTAIQELDQFITAMNQADSFGVSIGNVLRVQAEQLRERRSELAEERAAKTPVKLLFPLLICIFPGLFTVLVGPAAIRIMENLRPALNQ